MFFFHLAFERFWRSRPFGFPTLQDGSRGPQDRPKTAKEAPQDGPKTAQEGLKTAPEASQTAQEAPKTDPRGAQDGAKKLKNPAFRPKTVP